MPVFSSILSTGSPAGESTYSRTIAAIFSWNNFERDNEVVVLGHWSGRSKPAGRAFESEWAMLWVFDGAKVKSYRAYEDTAMLAKAFAAR